MNLCLTKIKLLGELGRKFGREWHLAVDSPAQAIRAIGANNSDFIKYLYESEERGIAYRVIIDNPLGIDESELNFPLAGQLIIAPIVQGAGGGLGKILLGVGLVAASFFMPASISIFGAAISSTMVGVLGAALVLNGVSSMLTPVQKLNNRNERTNSDAAKSNSFLFDRAAELGDQGGVVPVGYGIRVISDPIILSSSITTEAIAV